MKNPSNLTEVKTMQTSDGLSENETLITRETKVIRKVPSKSLIRIAVVASVVLIALAIFLVMNAMKPKAVLKVAPTPVLTVSTINPTIQPIERSIKVNGTISAWDPVSVGSQAGGLEIKSVLVEEGDVVRKGQLLATLDSSVLLPQLESERARLQAALATARKAVQPNRVEDINGLRDAVAQAEANVAEQEAAIVQANANLVDAKLNVDRYVKLEREGAVSTQDWHTRLTNAKVAEAVVRSSQEHLRAAKFALSQAKERLNMAQVGGRAEDIQIANASVNEIRGNVKRLEAMIAQTYIKAPVSGLITRRDAHIGDIATAGKTMFVMARDNRLELRGQVAETDLPSMRPGELVTITSSATGNHTIAGRVREISPAIDTETRLGTVRIDAPTNAGIKVGMFAEGKINIGKTAVLTVPARSVISQDEKTFVYIVGSDNRVQARTILAGTRAGNLVEVLSGLQPQDAVVTDGAGFLKDGDLVAVGK